MSVSKLESLPNEILTDILEKYINGVDILINFAFQLNQRFDALIFQSQRLRFDFMRCYKNDFIFCIGLLPAYIDKIEELCLSEQNTPGQIHAFLSLFPSFGLFKRLRKLYFHTDAKAVEMTTIQRSLHSLSKTNLHTLSIKITNCQEMYSLSDAFVNIFCMRTLKKLSITCDSYEMDWTLLNEISSNVEYLMIYGMRCNSQELEYILRCVSGLKHLNIQLTVSGSLSYKLYQKRRLPSKNITTQMPKLQSAIFYIEDDAAETFRTLESHLLGMASLQGLKIKVNSGIFDADVWETFVKTSLPKLTHFNLQSNALYTKQADIHTSLESFQTPFWIEKKNFNIIITKYERFESNFDFIGKARNFNQFTQNKSIPQCWIAPRREFNGNLSSMSKITSLQLSTEGSALLQHHYFDNISHLVLHDMNLELFEWIKTHINCSRIKHLDISDLDKESNTISLLLPSIRNIISLRMKPDQLFNYQHASLETVNCLKFLDISANQHRFVREDIAMVAKLFPNVQHLNYQYTRYAKYSNATYLFAASS